jgi:7-cyano-7-deazaguanine synthase
MSKKAICLLSGGLDSATTLYAAIAKGYEIRALTIHYGQLHERELACAKILAQGLKLEHQVMALSLPWKGSALLDASIPMPTGRTDQEMAQSIPVTYVPARNTIFLSLAASYAEASSSEILLIGANILDYSGYPDCRPEYFQSLEETLRLGTKAGAEGRHLHIETPLLKLSKKEIIEWGMRLGVPYDQTWSCYQGQKAPCGECDACRLRAKGFREAGYEDPLLTYEKSRH